jgi:hypothetical protein
MRTEDYERLKEIAAELFAAQSDEMRQAVSRRLKAEFDRIDALVVSRTKAA